jgi:hypothetical protein
MRADMTDSNPDSATNESDTAEAEFTERCADACSTGELGRLAMTGFAECLRINCALSLPPRMRAVSQTSGGRS